MIPELLKTRFGLPSFDVRPLRSGDSATAYAAELSPGRSVVVKVYRHADWAEPDIERIRCGAAFCDSTGGKLGPVAVPRPVRATTGDWLAYDGEWFATVQQAIPTMPPPWRAYEQGVAVQLGEALSALHREQAAVSRIPDRDVRFIPGDDIATSAAELGALGRAGGGLSARQWPAAEINRLRDRVHALGADPALEFEKLVLSHGDVTMANLIVPRPRRAALIDWDGIYYAPPEFEFAPLALERPDLLTPMLAGYYRTAKSEPAEARLLEFHMIRYVLFGLSFHLSRLVRSARGEPVRRDRDSAEVLRYLGQSARMRNLVEQMRTSCQHAIRQEART